MQETLIKLSAKKAAYRKHAGNTIMFFGQFLSFGNPHVVPLLLRICFCISNVEWSTFSGRFFVFMHEKYESNETVAKQHHITESELRFGTFLVPAVSIFGT